MVQPLSKLVSVLVVYILCNKITSGQRNNNINNRQDVINQWIRTIREAPKGHSLSPSWTSKARPQIIGVANLPLQNEAVQLNSENSVPNFNSINNHHNFNAPVRQKRFPGMKFFAFFIGGGTEGLRPRHQLPILHRDDTQKRALDRHALMSIPRFGEKLYCHMEMNNCLMP